MKIQFLGATGTVTGSKYLITTEKSRILVDCGLYQGLKDLRLRNWQPLPIKPDSLDAVVLTHAHIDHTGYIPLLVKQGFRGHIFATSGTAAQCHILLPDSGRLQEEEARFANKRGYSKHKPALPLYTEEDADISLKSFITKKYGEDFHLPGNIVCRFENSGHILGSAIVRLTADGKTITFTGDLGRPKDPVFNAPVQISETDYLVLESTYGSRVHDQTPVEDLLEGMVNDAWKRKSVILVPAFSVGRSQLLLYYLSKLREDQRIPEIPVYLNSPMSINATGIFCDHLGEHRLTPAECKRLCAIAKYVRTPEESKRLNDQKGPMVIISANGMATGGRIIHHLKAFAPDANNTILFTGFQAAGTRGASMLRGAETIRIHGADVPVRAKVEMLYGLSAHADSTEMIGWLRGFSKPPKLTFITHGEPDSAKALQDRISADLGWPAEIPEYEQEMELK